MECPWLNWSSPCLIPQENQRPDRAAVKHVRILELFLQTETFTRFLLTYCYIIRKFIQFRISNLNPHPLHSSSCRGKLLFSLFIRASLTVIWLITEVHSNKAAVDHEWSASRTPEHPEDFFYYVVFNWSKFAKYQRHEYKTACDITIHAQPNL